MRRLCLFSDGFAMAAAVYLWLLHAAPWPLLALLGVLCAALFFLRGRLARCAAICVLGLLVGFAWCRGYEAVLLRPLTAYTGRTLPVTAQATGSAQKTRYGSSVEVRLRVGSRSCDAILYYDAADGPVEPGSRLSCVAKLTGAQDKQTGGSYELSRGVALLASCRGTLHTQTADSSLRYAPARLAELLREQLRKAFDTQTAGFMQALILGDKSELDYAARNELAIAGIYHAVAVSGMHVSILLGMILLLCGSNHRLAAALGLPAMLFFILMTGAPASAVRAGVMQAVVLCAPLLRREYDPPTAISAALLVLLAQNPWSMLDAGLQLSFASTTGIVLFSGRLYRALTENRRVSRLLRPQNIVGWLLRAMLTALCCTLSSMVFALPITALQFGEISLAAPFVNVLVLWLLSGLFCAGLLLALLALAAPGAAAALGWLVSWPVRLVWLIVRAAARVPFAALYPENGYLITAAVFVYALILLLALRPGRVRLFSAAAAAAVVIACCLGLSALDYRLPQMSFTVLDVGQGQCLIFRVENSVSIIDCGGTEDESGELAARYLLSRGVTSVDRLILTHYDADHCNGTTQLLRRVQVGTLYLPVLSDESAQRAGLLLAAARSGTKVEFVTQDVLLPLTGGSLELFAPTGDADEENTGLCILASSEKYDILITGDLSTQAEYRLLSTHTLPQLTALVAGHHGAKSSTSEVLLRTLMPQLVFISVGADNRFGHPAEQTLARIAESGAAVYRTDRSGTITIRG